VVFYLGLAAALFVYAAAFGKKLLKLIDDVFQLGDAESVLSMLALIDAALVASLIVMVMISGYKNFVSRFDEHKSELTWLGKIDAGSLRIKVASTIVAISSIHLLQIFLNSSEYPEGSRRHLYQTVRRYHEKSRGVGSALNRSASTSFNVQKQSMNCLPK
jgi:uncharacterized protein (TIGR00645 family)